MKKMTTAVLFAASLILRSGIALAQDLTDDVIFSLKATTIQCQDEDSGDAATISFENCKTGDNRNCDVALESDGDRQTLINISSTDFSEYTPGQQIIVSYGLDSTHILSELAQNYGMFNILGDGTGFYHRFESDFGWTALFPTNKLLRLTGCQWGNH